MKPKPEAGDAPSDLRERALRLLARREHSRAELARKLEHARASADRDIAQLLDEFEDKELAVRPPLRRKLRRRPPRARGSLKLAYDLRQRGVSDGIVELVLGDNRDSELDRAREIWKKKFGARPADITEKAKQIRFMHGRGFTQEIIQKVMRETE